ncbi:MAG TPA: ATP-dependent helicase [Solirubrobacteraceae bacterium]|nr:ATP-dependent helicase [Solirubrobacteraceae bacterium]
MFDSRSASRSSAVAAAAVENPAWFEELNPEQRAAVRHPGGPLLILAGAGTGKTTTLCSRVAWLVSEGVAPERILLLTFTRRAAREMQQRARALVAMPGGARGMLGGTFHSVAHHFVRQYAAVFDLPTGFGLLDAGDAADVLDLLREEHGHAQSRQRFPKKSTLLDIYSRTVNAMAPLAEVLAGSFPWCEEHRESIGALFKAYTARKKALGVVDLDDLLLYWRALVADEVIGPELERRFDHVLIDEYQDVNGLQVDIVRGLRRECREVTAVGDDFQAIYGWRAASVEHILSFPSHFPDATVISLERNYRSSQPILDLANALAAQATRAFGKQLRAQREGGVRPEMLFVRDESAQAVEVCDRVLEAREHGMELRHQAVLMRTSHDSALLELELARRQIPFVKYGGLRYLEAAHVKDLIALFRLADNLADEIAWFRVLQLLDGVGPATARRALDVLITTDGNRLAGWPRARERLPEDARPLADGVVAALGDAQREASAGVRAERLSHALAPLVRAHYPDGALRLQDLDQLVAAAQEASELGRFVSEVVIDPPVSSADLAGPPHLDEDYLVLSTVHSAKGLEWQAVHVLSVYDGNFPACMSAGTSETIDEERRLLYVAMTRARRQLHLYVPVRYYHRPGGIDDAHGYGKPSRFLTPAVRELCEVKHTGDTGPGANGRTGRPPRRIVVSVDALFD